MAGFVKFDGKSMAVEREEASDRSIFWDVSEETIYMLLIYKKSKQEDLTSNQLKTLRSLVKDYLT